MLALPVFLLAGWSLKGWGIAAVLWVATQAFGLLLTRVQPSADNLARSGVLAFGMMIRLLAVLVVLLAVVSSDAHAGLAARGLRARVHGRARLLAARLLRPGADRMRLRNALLTLAGLALVAPAPAFARGTFDPTTEFEQHEWVPIHLGPLNLSITKAVAYLMIGTVLTILLGLLLMRGKTINRRQTIGRADLRRRADADRRAGAADEGDRAAGSRTSRRCCSSSSSVNLIGFIPLPLTGETWHGVPTWGIYAATSSLSVTLALALLTFVFTHFEGIRWNGPVRYFKSWIPDAPKPLLLLIVPLEILGQFMRLISLSVRLFANMLAGHILILTFIGLLFILQHLVPRRPRDPGRDRSSTSSR